MTLCLTHPIKSVTAEGECVLLVFSASFTESLSHEDVQQRSANLTWKLAPNIWKATTSLISATSNDNTTDDWKHAYIKCTSKQSWGLLWLCAVETFLIMLYVKTEIFLYKKKSNFGKWSSGCCLPVWHVALLGASCCIQSRRKHGNYPPTSTRNTTFSVDFLQQPRTFFF